MSAARPLLAALALWMAQGFGVGRIGRAPGTLGSLLGMVWTVCLLALGSGWVALLLMISGWILSILCCGRAERLLGRTDPPSVVLDEIVAVPLCFAGWVAAETSVRGALPSPAWLFLGENWLVTLAGFVAFRFFDIVKPWPVRQSQKLPGGWGVTLDDLLAAAYVNGCFLLALVAFRSCRGDRPPAFP